MTGYRTLTVAIASNPVGLTICSAVWLAFGGIALGKGSFKPDYVLVIPALAGFVFGVGAFLNSLRYYFKERVPKEFKYIVMDERVAELRQGSGTGNGPAEYPTE